MTPGPQITYSLVGMRLTHWDIQTKIDFNQPDLFCLWGDSLKYKVKQLFICFSTFLLPVACCDFPNIMVSTSILMAENCSDLSGNHNHVGTLILL